MDDREFSRLLKICRIQMGEAERAKVKGEVDEILEYFNSLGDVDTKGMEEAFHPITVPEKLRKDEASDFNDINMLLKNTKTYRFYVVGPNV